MLAYFLAIAIGLGSSILYLTAFFSPKIHRQDDFLWSGVGLFYALVLWFCAGQMRGGVLLGQAAAVFLLLVLGWQTLQLRRAIAYPERQGDLEGFSLTQWLRKRMGKKSAQPPSPELKTAATTTEGPEKAVSEVTTAAPPMPEAEREVESEVAAAEKGGEVEVAEETEETEIKEIEPEAKSELPAKKSFSLKDFLPFGKGKSAERPETIAEALDVIELDEIETQAGREEIGREEAEEEGEVIEIPTASAAEEVSPATETAEPPSLSLEEKPTTELTEPASTKEVTNPDSPTVIEENSGEIETLFELSSGEPEPEPEPEKREIE